VPTALAAPAAGAGTGSSLAAKERAAF
jgi:hypothetical protein